MDELRKALAQARDLWKKQPPGRRLGIVAALIATALVVGVITLRGSVESYQTLFAGLPADEAGRIVEQLKADKVPFRLVNAGTGIEVPEAKVHETRLALAQKGMPHGGGIGFELFDKQSFGTTSFVEQMNYRRALQGELARTVMALEEVETARVHLSLPERSLYKQNQEPASASIALKLRPGRKLLPGQVRGIVHLVAGSVEGLTPERVTVIDETGNVLSQSDDAAGQLDAQSALEKSLELRVREMVGKLVGEGHVAVVVTAEMDYSRTQRTELQVGKEGTISHENHMEERAGADVGTAGGVAGARGNLPGTGTPTTPTTGPGTSGLVKLSDDKQYEISKVTETTVNPNSRIKRLHLAILVDQADKTPRSADELARISALAREAAGFSKERGDLIEVHSAPFATAPAEPEPAAPVSSWPLPIPPLYAAIAAGGLILLVAGGAIFFVMRRKKAKNKRQVLTALPVKVSELEKTAEGGQLPGGSTVPQLPEKSPRERALEACKTDAERAARVIAAWLLEGQEGGRSA